MRVRRRTKREKNNQLNEAVVLPAAETKLVAKKYITGQKKIKKY